MEQNKIYTDGLLQTDHEVSEDYKETPTCLYSDVNDDKEQFLITKTGKDSDEKQEQNNLV